MKRERVAKDEATSAIRSADGRDAIDVVQLLESDGSITTPFAREIKEARRD